MRVLLFIALIVAVPACKKQAEGTVARFPDAALRPTSDPVKTPDSTLIHTILRAPAGRDAVMGFYKADLERRGAHRTGDSFSDDNVVHENGFGVEGSAHVNDPSKPGVWLGVAESGTNTTDVDIWENIPKAP